MPTKFVDFEHTKCAVLFIINTNRLIHLYQPAYQSRPSKCLPGVLLHLYPGLIQCVTRKQ